MQFLLFYFEVRNDIFASNGAPVAFGGWALAGPERVFTVLPRLLAGSQGWA